MAPLIIKVCGMTEAENIRNVEQLDVDMIGFILSLIHILTVRNR